MYRFFVAVVNIVQLITVKGPAELNRVHVLRLGYRFVRYVLGEVLLERGVLWIARLLGNWFGFFLGLLKYGSLLLGQMQVQIASLIFYYKFRAKIGALT